MKIGIDIMGGDYAPEEAIKGVISYLTANAGTGADVHFLLIGNPDLAAPYLSLLDAWQSHYTLVPSATVIGMHEHPTKALKEKQDSSIAIGFGLLQAGKIDAFFSAGNTGAMLVGAMYTVKAIPGVLRPTIASPIPKLDGQYNFLLDVGANADCKPEHLVQFALMGSLYAKHILNLNNPRVGLLNLGEEEGKGNILAQATYPLLKQHSGIHFIGNVEGRDLFLNNCDVIVCEGFTGNVALKMAESIYNIFTENRKIQDNFLNQFNYEIYGGTPILGVNAPVLIGHGISNARAFCSMIESAIKLVASNFTEILRNSFAGTTEVSLEK
ncbi:phosphate acyltransferase PlsX [Taibaiella koreensis]|uniref:phosphate acyltransferase PlsX n=1 Tax=Taibaiella koreensis TaxID=1268548 RepID=UPI000E59CB32|nr:phosphate acyltransferase PlsX [Taibaiella koreensis]